MGSRKESKEQKQMKEAAAAFAAALSKPQDNASELIAEAESFLTSKSSSEKSDYHSHPKFHKFTTGEKAQ